MVEHGEHTAGLAVIRKNPPGSTSPRFGCLYLDEGPILEMNILKLDVLSFGRLYI